MHEGGAVKQFDSGGPGVGRARIRVAAGPCNRQAKLGPDPVAYREDGVTQGRGQQRRRSRPLSQIDRALQSSLYPIRRMHRRSHVSHCSDMQNVKYE